MRRLLITILSILLMTGMAFAGDKIGEFSWMVPSGQKTSDYTASGDLLFYGIAVSTDGTNAVTVNVWDTSQSIRIIPEWTVTTSSTDRTQTFSLNPPIRTHGGYWVQVVTDGSVKFVTYQNKK